MAFDDFGSVFYCVVDPGEGLALGDMPGHPGARVMRFPPGTSPSHVMSDIRAAVGRTCDIFFLDAGEWVKLAAEPRDWAGLVLKIVKPRDFHLFHNSKLVRFVKKEQIATEGKQEQQEQEQQEQEQEEQEQVWTKDNFGNLAQSFFKTQQRAPFVPELIFVRAEYIELLQFLLTLTRKPSRVLYIGNPGVGKSMGGLVLLFLLVQLGLTVVYHNERAFGGRFYIFKDRRLHDHLKKANQVIEEYLLDPAVMYIHDGKYFHLADDVGATTLMISSPDTKVYKDFKKTLGLHLFYANLWSPEELKKCLLSFRGMTWEKCLDRIYFVGHVPRLLFYDDLEFESCFELVESSIKQTKGEVVGLIGRYDTGSKFSHTVVAVSAGKTRAQGVVRFASKYAEEQVLLRIERSLWNKLVTQYERLGGVSALASFRGTIFEVMVQSTFPEFLTDCVRLCDHVHEDHTDNTSFLQEIKPEMVVVFYRNYMDLMNKMCACYLQREKQKQVYFRPRRKTEAAVDSIYVDFAEEKAYLLQMTVSKRHRTLWQPVKKLVSLLNELDIKVTGLYFVTGEDNYEEFKYQTWKKLQKTPDGSDFDDRQDSAGLGLCQLKIKFRDIPPQERPVLVDTLSKGMEEALSTLEVPNLMFKRTGEVIEIPLDVVKGEFEIADPMDITEELPFEQADAEVPGRNLEPKVEYNVVGLETYGLRRGPKYGKRRSQYLVTAFKVQEDGRKNVIRQRTVGRQEVEELARLHNWPIEVLDQA